MAARSYYNGKDIIVFIKRINKTPTPETVYRPVVCLDSNSFSLNKELKEVVNKCTDAWRDGIAGKGDWGGEMSGQAISDGVISAEANFQELLEITASGEKAMFKFADPTGTVYREGLGLLTAYSEDAGAEDPLSFTATLAGLGTPVLVEPEG